MGRTGGWIVAGTGLLAVVLAGLWLSQPEAAEAGGHGERPFVVPVLLSTVERADLQPRATLSGTVRAARRAQLGFDTSGIVQLLDAVEADTVVAGALLARLNSGDEEHEVLTADAALALAQRERDLLVAGERDEEKRRLYAVLEATRAESELARLEVERGSKLLADRIIAQSEQDSRETAHNAADKRRAAAEEDHARAIAGSRPEDLAIASARVDAAQARLAAAQHELSKNELVAPWPGAIVKRFVSVGDYVASGAPVFELVDLDHLEVHIEVPARLASKLGERSSARLSLPGHVSFVIEKDLAATIAAADEMARSFRGIVRLDPGDDVDRTLKPGMFVQVDMRLTALKNQLVVPSDCVLSDGKSTYVVRAIAGEGKGGEAAGLVADFVPVRVVAQVDGRSAVVTPAASLEDGDILVLTGGDNAFPGATLIPLSTGKPGDEPSSESGPESKDHGVAQ